jgi:hypothetical protein
LAPHPLGVKILEISILDRCIAILLEPHVSHFGGIYTMRPKVEIQKSN